MPGNANIGFEIIDCHIHPPMHAENYSGWFLPYDRPEAFVSAMRASGISRACGACVNPATSDFSGTEGSNRSAFEFQARFPDFYISAIQVHPHFPAESCREVERAWKQGVRWIGELVGYLSGYAEDYDTTGAFQIYDLAQQLGMVVNLHCDNLSKVERMCESFRKLPFVLAHPGAGKQGILDRLRLVAKHPNLYLDLSGTGVTRWGMLWQGVETAGAEKLLFGTDFPICTPASVIACVMAEPISDKDREAIFAGNFKRLTAR